MSVLRLALMIMGILSEMDGRVNIFSVYDIWQKYSSLWEKGFFNLFFYTGNIFQIVIGIVIFIQLCTFCHRSSLFMAVS